MTRALSITARRAGMASSSVDVEIVLLLVRHPDIPATELNRAGEIRISSDATDALSLSPLRWGTRSTWQTAGDAPYYFCGMGIECPGEDEDAPSAGRLTLQALDARLVDMLTTIRTPARVDMAIVQATSPDLAEQEMLGLQMTSAEGDAVAISLTFDLRPIFEEPWPADRMTRQRYPGLHP
jgi:hypothetical protein